MVTAMQKLGLVSREYEQRANEYEEIAMAAATAAGEHRKRKAQFMAHALADGASAAKAEVLANADNEIAEGYTWSLQTAAIADAAKSKLTQLRESVATGRTAVAGEREADRMHAAGLSGAA